MKSSKICYGITNLEANEFPKANSDHIIELEYYKIKEIRRNILGKTTKKYGIEILKKEYKNNNLNVESNTIVDISKNQDKVIEIINKLKKYKVTPISLNDVVEDLLKQNSI